MTIQTDLERLKRIDPILYAKLGEVLNHVDIEYEDDLIQGEIQRACQKHGWSWKVGDNRGGTSWASICGMKFHEAGKTPAAAILRAYLTACEGKI